VGLLILTLISRPQGFQIKTRVFTFTGLLLFFEISSIKLPYSGWQSLPDIHYFGGKMIDYVEYLGIAEALEDWLVTIRVV